MLAWLLIVLVICACWAYIEFTPKDVDPEFVNHQASVSATKLPGESAVLRSLANEHGTALLGSIKPLSQFRFASIWDEVATFKINYVTQQNQVKGITNFESLVGRIQSAISEYPPNSDITMSFPIGVEALVAIFAVVLSGRIPKLVEEGPKEDQDDPVDSEFTLFSKPILSLANYKFTQSNTGICIQQPDGGSVLVSLDELPKGSLEEPDNKVEVKRTEHDFLRTETAKISQVELGVAVAAQLIGLGLQNRWTSSDSVFIAPGPLTPFAIVTMLTALSAKAPLVFAETGPMLTATSVLLKMRPTVLVSDDETMRTLCKQTDDFQVFNWLKFAIIRARLAKGALTKPAMIPGFNSVRLIHTASGADPFRWLSNSDIAKLRVLTGVQVIHVYTPGNSLALCQTSIGDYRSGKQGAGVAFGPPLPGVEIKLRGSQLLAKQSRSNHFEAVNAESSEGAKLAGDGCLYVPEKRQDFSERYYYTGELN